MRAAHHLAEAIARRDVARIRGMLAPGFLQRSHGAAAVDQEGFLRGIEQIPGDIVLVRLDGVEVDVVPTGALVTGTQHAEVRLDGEVVQDRRMFVDWFVNVAGEWRVQAAVDLPAGSPHQR